MQISLKGISGQVKTEKEKTTASSFSFAPSVDLGLTGLVIPELASVLLEDVPTEGFSAGSRCTLRFSGMSFQNGGDFLEGISYQTLDVNATMLFPNTSGPGLFGEDPIRSLSIVSKEPMKFINNRLDAPIQGSIAVEIEYSDGQRNSFELKGMNGRYEFDGRLRSPDGGEFELVRESGSTRMKGILSFKNGQKLESEITFPFDRTSMILASKSVFNSVLGEKELEVELTGFPDGTVEGYWSSFKPIFRQGDLVSEGSMIVVRDANRQKLAKFAR